MKRVIVTVGPSLFEAEVLKNLHQSSNIYRINGAHGTPKEIEQNVTYIRSVIPEADILMDLPGCKVRCTGLKKSIDLDFDKEFKILSEELNYSDFYRHIKIGDEVLADDSTLNFVITAFDNKGVTFKSHSVGTLLKGKGLHVKGISDSLPFLFEKDKDLIDIANRHDIAFVGLSFVRDETDIFEAKKLIKEGIGIITKVETKKATQNLNGILENTEFILIDRGDLSTEVGLIKLPFYQKFIIEKAHFNNRKVFLATQFLKNMQEKPVPTIAEVIDMYNTMKTGIYGIQLSEETAIGKYPAKCLELINSVITEIEEENCN